MASRVQRSSRHVSPCCGLICQVYRLSIIGITTGTFYQYGVNPEGFPLVPIVGTNHMRMIAFAQNVDYPRKDRQLPKAESPIRIDEARVRCRGCRVWLWSWHSSQSDGPRRKDCRRARAWLGKKMYKSTESHHNSELRTLILIKNLAGSFPYTLSQCLGDINVSGSSANNSFISKWLSPGDPTKLFQLTLGNGQHVFSAHGM